MIEINVELLHEIQIGGWYLYMWTYDSSFVNRSRLDELRMFLENEGWELCPVKSTFTILQLQVSQYILHFIMKCFKDIEEQRMLKNLI